MLGSSWRVSDMPVRATEAEQVLGGAEPTEAAIDEAASVANAPT